MRCSKRVLGVFLGVVAALAAASCSDANDDSLGTACKVIVDQCHVGPSVGDCIDGLGEQPQECIDCIASSGCADYASCQRLPSGCRIPTAFLGK